MRRPVSDDEARRIFDEVRVKYDMLPVTLRMHDEDITSHVVGMSINLPRMNWADDAHFRGVLCHEFGHPYYMPVFTENHYVYIDIFCKSFGICGKATSVKWVIDDAVNVIYDMFVDRKNQLFKNVDLEHMVIETLKSQEKGIRKRMRGDPLFRALHAYYFVCLGEIDAYPVKPKECDIDEAYRVLGIIDNDIDDNYCKFSLVCNILKDKIEEAKGNYEDLFRKMSKMPISTIPGPDQGGIPMLQETDDPLEAVKGKISGATWAQLKKLSKKSFSEGESFLSVMNFRKEAKQKIRALNIPKQINSNSRVKSGNKVRNGVWKESMRMKELDVLASIRQAGVIVPNERAVRVRRGNANSPESGKSPRMIIIMDTSISMAQHDGTVALYSFIEYAREISAEVSVSLFHTKNYFFEAAKTVTDAAYINLETKIEKMWESGGTNMGTSMNLLDQKIDNNKKSMIVFVGDYIDSSGNVDFVRKKLENYASEGHYVVNITYGGVVSNFSKNVMAFNVCCVADIAEKLIKASYYYFPLNKAL